MAEESAPGPHRSPQEATHTSEVIVRPFNPENRSDVLRLHKIDLATRDTTVDITKGKGAISEKDLKEWMECDYFYAMVKGKKIFGFVWFTEDPDNPQETPEVKNFLIQHAYRGRELVELSHGELPNTPESQIIAGLKESIIRLMDGLGSKLPPVITAYTTDEEETAFLVQVGFQMLGTIHQYVTRMDDESLDIVDEEHAFLVLDPQVSPQ